jgi:cold shock CspA family protein/tetratricopeptide (TPR) repeat protein
MFPEQYQSFRVLAEEALNNWTPGATFRYKPLKPGYSGAVVFKIDISDIKSGNITSGQYILKLSRHSKWVDQDSEIDAHNRAFDRAIDFSKAHLPVLVKTFDLPDDKDSEEGGYAMLYEIAGFSLDAFTAADYPEHPGFMKISEELMTDILNCWVEADPVEEKSPAEILESWLDYRLDSVEGRNLHEFVSATMGDHLVFQEGGEVVINPIKFYQLAKAENWDKRISLKALVHGDLHGGNVLIHRNLEPHSYWIIDFGLSKINLAGYDQSYLEVSQIISNLSGRNTTQLIRVLRQLDDHDENVQLLPGTFWLKNCLEKMRTATKTWQQVSQPRRFDDINHQFCLSRIAAGLNWANKEILPENKRRLALSYAGWYARKYLQTFRADVWSEMWELDQKQKKKSKANGEATQQTANESTAEQFEEHAWNELWETVNGFSIRSEKFILIAEGFENNQHVKALGQLPWSAVIDLDPSSDENGLHQQVASILATYRGLHTFSNNIPVISYQRGTAWMMAAGWNRKDEIATDFDNWTYDYLPVIRKFLSNMENAVNPDSLCFLVLPGKGLDEHAPMARLTKIIDAAVEVTRGRAKIILLGDHGLSGTLKYNHIPLHTATFLKRLENIFGSSSYRTTAQIPSLDDQWKTIPVEALRTMQENFTVLHSNILEEENLNSREHADTFWRGHPPTWLDYNNGNDIERPINLILTNTLREKLSEFRNHTILLHHDPGAGGTTAALRAAWDLHTEYPVAILTKSSEALAVRLRSLYDIAQKPVLLVVEASELTDNPLEKLYRELAGSGTRVVLLYIQRVFNAGIKGGLSLSDPMDEKQAKDFYDSYVELTTEPRRKQELSRITNDESLIRYRSPFFYGLITFQDEFLAVDKYVTEHVKGLRGKQRDIIEYLALVTIYSNSGLSESTLRRMMNISENSSLSLEEIFGEGPFRLVSNRNGYWRLMHQLLAEEVLNHLQGGTGVNWKTNLAKLSIEFIKDLASSTGRNSQTILDLSRQMFTERYGSATDEVEDKHDFAPIIEDVDAIDKSLGHRILTTLTECFPEEAHFWTHLGRHQIYKLDRDREKAEEFLNIAISLAPDDYIHHHVLGLVRRSRVRQLLREIKNENPLSLLEAINPFFEGASEAFKQSRSLEVENPHGYIAHAQMILEVAEKIVKSAGAENIGQIQSSEINKWVEENISSAEDLLSSVRQLYGTLESQEHFLTACYAKLQSLYGNVDQVIQLWEISILRKTDNFFGRRSLVHAYLARKKRKWSAMQLSELRRIVGLMEENLRSTHRSDEDYRLWFEAYKLLPEFDIEEALSRLNVWAAQYPSWRAYYFIYVLHFYLWFSGRTETINEMETALRKCQELIFGRKNFSYLWLSHQATNCPLVSYADLDWDKKLGFWKDTSLMRTINGVIDDPIQTLQAGRILVDNKVKVFFVPFKDEFYPHQDENERVNFFVGFSPEGIRAWKVKRGHVPDANRVSSLQPKDTQYFTSTKSDISEQERTRLLDSLRIERVREFVKDFIQIKLQLGAEPTVSELNERVDAVFGVDDLFKSGTKKNIEDFLRESSRYILVPTSGEVFIADKNQTSKPEEIQEQVALLSGCILLYDEIRNFGFISDGTGPDRFFSQQSVYAQDRHKLKQGRLVEFTPSENEKGLTAAGIRVLGVTQQDLRDVVKAVTLRILIEAENTGQHMKLEDLDKKLYRIFRDKDRLTYRLGYKNLQAFLEAINLHIAGQKPDLIVLREEEHAFGRLRPVRRDTGKPKQNDDAKSKQSKDQIKSKNSTPPKIQIKGEALVAAVQKHAVLLVREGSAKHNMIAATDLGNALSSAFPGEGKLVRRLGCESLLKFLREIPELEITKGKPNVWEVRLRSG